MKTVWVRKGQRASVRASNGTVIYDADAVSITSDGTRVIEGATWADMNKTYVFADIVDLEIIEEGMNVVQE